MSKDEFIFDIVEKFNLDYHRSIILEEILKGDFNSDSLTVSFNARYLLDIASEIGDENLTMSLNDAISPVLIQDKSDNHSYYVIMPMKI